MPFTLSHAAAALPFRRTRLVPSALLIGTFAPDLEYFIRLAPGGGWGHTLVGACAMSLPLGLATLWVFHRFVKVPFVYLLPDRMRGRLTDQLLPFRFGPASRFLNIVLSMLVGIATHLVWDGFTHPEYWIVRHSPILWGGLMLPVVGWFAWFSMLQLLSTILGLVVVALWCRGWYRRTVPARGIPPNPWGPSQRTLVVVLIVGAACVGAFLRAWISVGVPHTHGEIDDFVNDVVVTAGALTWWQLAMWGIFGPFRRSHSSHGTERLHDDEWGRGSSGSRAAGLVAGMKSLR